MAPTIVQHPKSPARRKTSTVGSRRILTVVVGGICISIVLGVIIRVAVTIAFSHLHSINATSVADNLNQYQSQKPTLGELLEEAAKALEVRRDWLLFFNWLAFFLVAASATARSRLLSLKLPSSLTPWTRKASQPSVFMALLVVTMLWFRFPVISTPLRLGMDESVFVAGGITLDRDPIFWRTLESTTSGPLNYYPLLASKLFGLSPDLAWSRLLAASVSAAVLILLYQICRLAMNDLVSRLAVLPLWIFWITALEPDFVQYSSDHIAILILCFAIFSGVRGQRRGSRAILWLSLCGFLLGLLPLAKLQSVIGGAAIGLTAIAAHLFVKRKQALVQRLQAIGYFVGAGLLPTAFTLFCVVGWGVFDRFKTSYLLFNFSFAAQVSPPFWPAIWQAIVAAFTTPEFSNLMMGLAFVVVVSVCVAASSTRLTAKRRCAREGRQKAILVFFLVFSGIALLVSVAMRGTVGTKPWFYHYLLYYVVPVVPLVALISDTCLRVVVRNRRTIRLDLKRRDLTLMVLYGLAITPGITRLNVSSEYLLRPQLYSVLRYPAESLMIKKLSRPSDSLAVWGWHPDFYVQSQLPQASSMSTSERELGLGEPSGLIEWFRKQYLQDIQRTRPSIFIDATGLNDWTYPSRQSYGHEQFPALTAYLNQNYVKLPDVNGSRIYIARARYLELKQEGIQFTSQ